MFPTGYPLVLFNSLVCDSCIWLEFIRRRDSGNGIRALLKQDFLLFWYLEIISMVQDENAFEEQRFPKK